MREGTLQQIRTASCDRFLSETLEEKEARLQRISARQHDRLASESVEDREARLHTTDKCSSA